jgi:hypothetical protein
VRVSFADPDRAFIGLDLTITAGLVQGGRPVREGRGLVDPAQASAARAAMRANIADFIQTLRTAMRARAGGTISTDTVLNARR